MPDHPTKNRWTATEVFVVAIGAAFVIQEIVRLALHVLRR